MAQVFAASVERTRMSELSEQYPPPNERLAYPPPPDYPPPPVYPSAPYPPPPAYPYPPPYSAPYAPYTIPLPARGTNGFAIASLVCGVLGLCSGLVGALPAIVFGHVALSQIKREEGIEEGRGLAIAGLVMGYLILGIGALWIVFAVVSAALSSAQAY
jgi:hypothetical protein